MNEKKDLQKILKRLSNSNQPIDFKKANTLTSDLQSYLDYYGFHIEDINYHFGKINIDGTQIMVQMFSPKESIGTIVLLHGYLDHVGILKNVIQYLNQHKYRVISYDLQGHGLSEGEEASVQSFSDYVITLEKLMNKTKQELSAPFYAIGHSTGGAILINYVLKQKETHFDKVILAAPLVRSNFWFFSKLGFYLTKPFPFIEDIHRNFRNNSSDKKFLNFIEKDPLQPKAIPTEWLSSLIHWNKEIHTYPTSNKETLLIQGTKDKTVEWKYNLNFVEEKFTKLHVSMIKNGRHQLFNEKLDIRNQVLQQIVRFLSKEVKT
ncbi:alpha/beta hydrolase [Gracilibacillus sp. YIM 98692]|uniref:alpha/beta hydrolase n=1 Tax=Gracilibacillus sp. YIM 98692 TaxID=2663532 RepID=UPI0013D5EB4B|nr:alpha/beta hydrolase [Gracilibacillus sp. YIM 98692]